jgi:hypothetical protein
MTDIKLPKKTGTHTHPFYPFIEIECKFIENPWEPPSSPEKCLQFTASADGRLLIGFIRRSLCLRPMHEEWKGVDSGARCNSFMRSGFARLFQAL